MTNPSDPKHIVNAPGYYDMPMRDYLDDPCVEPSLSTKIAHTLFYETPAHARLRHPRLRGEKPDATPRADIGSAVHELARGHTELVVYAPAEFDDWRKGAAKEFRDDARAAGKIPLLEYQRMQVELAGTNAANAIAALGSGKFEQTVIYQAEGVWFRGRADWLSDGAVQIGDVRCPSGVDVDLKTVESAQADSWLRTNVTPAAQELDVQMRIRHRGHVELTGYERTMAWLLQEIEAPYEHAWIIVTPMMLEQAGIKVDCAARIWRRCLDTETWPGYGARVTMAEPGAWAEMDIKLRLAAHGVP